ncbi:MAG: hypothetical protein A2312_00210 [Candidatus Staskawiczbacteria bacterium RIFOXYB2_FULL_32_9]|uniref:Uncharacterized protein n=1 Tax=Candidatus Staskawiczbacteria bacterium RIFOXYD1_FULL_32_13 TaxID=1802234 RepID=A0A1G2JJT8_9BACT|nr:MAG: hypothetical protein UR22_C0006G0057 [Parcubacteria group bacterium GW2011_GWC2_32_10]OGZ79552.1 MAG: hypothetical protein A2256_00850 [Candidatus Staskawiczbacteria bacterium RIFOXYA2_FULL_32_7]OGZ84849.1 MAG: hypothetical protein A2312_00210 [Candidatus Staskawiczbacteria bacterium RIFOXYB2_FULL_32_9]OGZ85430.1 MAG: hypothetical protein A2463_04255 [Candidatus Staskawiczbacteria bacterium RIFOXYC2_FULL_32_10]OGZ87395.1 MAG: hypothetical protein A2561_04905 [Candidatus Staskawiczbacter
MDCRRVGCDGQMNEGNKERVGLWSQRILLVCPKCKLCHEETGADARSKKVKSNVLVWDTVCPIEVPETSISLKLLATHHYDDDLVWLQWKGLDTGTGF